MLGVLAVLLVALVVVLAVAVVAAILLGLGTLLALLFPVSVWQATIVVMVAAAGALWFFTRMVPAPFTGPDLDELDEDELDEDELAEPPIVVIPDLPLPRPPRGRRRR